MSILSPIARIAGTVILILGTVIAAAQDETMRVQVDPVRTELDTQSVSVIGRLVATRGGDIAARIGGPINEVVVQVGDRVKQKDVIARLDITTLQLQRQLAEAEISEANARISIAREQLALAKQEVQRLDRLKNSAATSKAVYDDARQSQKIASARLQEANAELATSKASLSLTEQQLKDAEIRAPFDGIITERILDTGAYVQAGQTIARIVSDETLEIEADIPFGFLSGLATGTKIGFTLDDGSQHEAVTRALIPQENVLTRTRAVRFTPTFSATSGPLATGQSVTITIPTSADREVVSVHKDAIIRRGEQSLVYIVNSDKVEIRPVRLGITIGQRFEVLEGLAPGEEVVIRGNERLLPEQKVEVIKPIS